MAYEEVAKKNPPKAPEKGGGGGGVVVPPVKRDTTVTTDFNPPTTTGVMGGRVGGVNLNEVNTTYKEEKLKGNDTITAPVPFFLGEGNANFNTKTGAVTRGEDTGVELPAIAVPGEAGYPEEEETIA